MKKISIWFLLLTAGFFSCTKYYEPVPVENLTDDYIWDNKDSAGKYATQYLTDLYASVTSGFSRIGGDFLDCASDDAVSSRTTATAVTLISGGGITIFNNPDDRWALSYEAIRKATIFLNNFHVVPLLNPAEKRSWFGEARLLRAFFYWELVRRWGGVPLMGDEARGLEDDVSVSRSSFETCVEYIVSECDRAIDSLRSDPVDDNNYGRWGKGAALALKARVLLFAASPLYNGGNTTGSDLNGYLDFDPQRWKRAADAAKAVMDLNVYTLQPDFRQIFISQRSVEVIAMAAVTQSSSVEINNGPINYSSAPAGGLTSPTQELVDVFGMSNGLPITDPLSGYNPDDPYQNRDPRLSYTVLYNGAMWLNNPIQTFNGGLQRPGGSTVQTRTGYYLRKFMGLFETGTQYSNQYRDWVIFRLGEVLLSYAEALNEFAGPSPEVFAAVEAVRQRAGLDPFTLDPAMTQEELRTLIRDERRKELAFEEHRYWDIRRWKIAGQVYNKPVHGIVIIRDGSGNFSYNTAPVQNTVFDESKMYFYPIPYQELVSNDNMVQNPGW